MIRFFIANPMLDREHVGPIVDYLHAQKIQTREIIDHNGHTTIEPPPQSNLQMRGRTAESLLAQVERWHHALGRTKGAENLFLVDRPAGPEKVQIVEVSRQGIIVQCRGRLN